MAANTMTQTMQPVVERGWRSGFANLLRKEFGAWWGTKSWLKHAVIWIGLLDLAVAAMDYFLNRDPKAHEDVLTTMIGMFCVFAYLGVTIGAVTSIQGAIIGERQSGTAAWVLSKPTSRIAFVLAKFLANSASLLVLGVLVPGAIFYVLPLLIKGVALPIGAFLAALGMLGLNVVFYVALGLLLGTLYKGRGAVTGTGIGVLMAGQIVPHVWDKVLYVTPWAFGEGTSALVAGSELPGGLLTSASLATVGWTVLFLVVALVRFNREEL